MLEKPKCMVIFSIKPLIKILKFIVPGLEVRPRGGAKMAIHGIVNMYLNLEKSTSLLPHMWKKTTRLVMMSMNPSSKLVKFMVLGSGVQALRWALYCHMVKLY